ncbi:MAG: DUF2284 domain-containing protein [Lachnospiraceae bacterium]|nr:DUF2284 domain-containing protein [Lachnospiraceae bacterium]
MTNQEIEAFITQFPIYQYTFINTEDIEFSDRVRVICKQECPRYGSSWSCPPAVGSVERCKAHCLEYPQALFFSSVTDIADVTDIDEAVKTKRDHENMTKVIEDYVRNQSMLVYTLSSDSCCICDKCTYPKNPCLHPEILHPCIESHGIIVTNLAEKQQMDYYLGEHLILWFSLIFFKTPLD